MTTANAALDLATDIAAGARITRWLVLDEGPPPWGAKRDQFRRWLRAKGGSCRDRGQVELCAWCTWADGTECPYCVGIYVAASIQVARRVAPRIWPVVARWLACAELAAQLPAGH